MDATQASTLKLNIAIAIGTLLVVSASCFQSVMNGRALEKNVAEIRANRAYLERIYAVIDERTPLIQALADDLQARQLQKDSK